MEAPESEDWRTFPTGASEALAMRRWIHARLLELASGQVNEAREAMLHFVVWRESQQWDAMPPDVRQAINRRVMAIWNDLQEPDADRAAAHWALERTLELL